MATALQSPESVNAGAVVGRKKTTEKRVTSESRRHGVLVRLRGDVVERAKKVAALLGKSMAEYISDRMDPITQQDLEVEARKLTKK